LNKLMKYYIHIEDYLKCAVLRDTISFEDGHKSIIEEITIDHHFDYKGENINPMNMLVDSLKGMSQESMSDGLIELIKKNNLDQITDKEIWSIMVADDKDIFDDTYPKFLKWIKGLNDKTRDAYIDRLLDDKSLIPGEEDVFGEGSEIEYHVMEDNEDVDYEKNIVISFLDEYTIMSHTNLDKIKDIRELLNDHGIEDIEMRKKDISVGTLYSLVFSSKRTPPENLEE